MNNGGVGIGGVVSTIGWEAGKKGGKVEEEKVIRHIQLRFGVSRDIAELAIELAEKCGAVERKNGKIRVRDREE